MPNIVYTVAERVEMVRQREQGLSYRRIVDHFAAAHPNRPIPSNSTVDRIVKTFYKSGNVDPAVKKVTYPNKQLAQETKLQILLKAQEGAIHKLKVPISKIAKEVDVSKSIVWRVLKDQKSESSKRKRNRQISQNEERTRSSSGRNMRDDLNADPNLIDRICFSDECIIQLVSTPNRRKNNHWQKLNVWIGLIGDKMIGPYFVNGHLNGDKYLRLLQKQIIPALKAVETKGLVIRFRQDGVPTHFSTDVKTYLDEVFPGRWVGSNEAAQWPSSPPDLSPQDRSLSDYLNNRVYAEGRVENLLVLRKKVTQVLTTMPPLIIADINDVFRDQLRRWTAMKAEENGS